MEYITRPPKGGSKGSNGGSIIVPDGLSTKGEIEYVLYDKSKPITVGSLHEFRGTGTRTAILPHLLKEDGTQLGVFDQTVTLDSTFDVPYTFHIVANYCDTRVKPVVHKQTYTILTKEIPAGSTRASLMPEVADNIPAVPSRPIYAIPELRLPIASFTLIFIFNTAPKTGELVVAVSRRF